MEISPVRSHCIQGGMAGGSGMKQKLIGAVAALALAVGVALPAQNAKADPAVTGIAAGGLALLAWGIYENPEQPDAQREFLVGRAGMFDVVDDENRAALFGAEYWFPWTIYRFRPQIGILGTTDGAAGGYIGLRHDVNFGKHLVISTDVNLAFVEPGDGKDLGSIATLRSGVAVGYRFDNGTRISLDFHHQSHGELFGDGNPGTETATLNIAIPTDKLFSGQLLEGSHIWKDLFGN